MPDAPCRKAYVAVNLDVDEEGNLIPGRSGGEMVECSLLNGSSISVAPLLRKWEAVESGTRLLSAERSLFFFMKAINGSSRQRRDMDDFVTRTD